MSRLFCVIPCYNEQEVLPETSKRLREKLESLIKNGKISDDSRIVFVNDGSKDDTWNIIETNKAEFMRCKAIDNSVYKITPDEALDKVIEAMGK